MQNDQNGSMEESAYSSPSAAYYQMQHDDLLAEKADGRPHKRRKHDTISSISSVEEDEGEENSPFVYNPAWTGHATSLGEGNFISYLYSFDELRAIPIFDYN